MLLGNFSVFFENTFFSGKNITRFTAGETYYQMRRYNSVKYNLENSRATDFKLLNAVYIYFQSHSQIIKQFEMKDYD